MAGRPKAIEDNRVFDVSKPSQSKPLSTSRPVITQRDDVEDDSVTTSSRHAPSVPKLTIHPLETAAEDAAEPVDDMKKEVDAEVKIDEENFTSPKLPIEEPEEQKEESETVPVFINRVAKEEESEKEESKVEDEPEEKTEEQPEEQQAEHKELEEPEKPEPKEEAKPEEETKEEEKPDQESPAEKTEDKTEEGATVGAVAEGTKAKKDTKEVDHKAAIDTKVQELVDSKKYFVPLAHDSGKKSGHKWLWITLVFLAVVIVVYLLLDAGVIGNNVTLPYEFIK